MASLHERILDVYGGKTPDVVPYMLDLSHWFYQKHEHPWDLSETYDEPERELIQYHKELGAGFICPIWGLSSRRPMAMTWRVALRNGALTAMKK